MASGMVPDGPCKREWWKTSSLRGREEEMLRDDSILGMSSFWGNSLFHVEHFTNLGRRFEVFHVEHQRARNRSERRRGGLRGRQIALDES